jgi:hypothetical protein
MRRCSALPTRLLALLLALAAVGGPLKTAALAGPLMTDLGTATPVRLSSPVPVLWPGHQVELPVRVTSSTSGTSTLRVLSLTATVAPASHACGAGNLRTGTYRWAPDRAAYTLAPGETVVVPLTVTMLDTGADQDACQGATFRIRFAATTEPVG